MGEASRVSIDRSDVGSCLRGLVVEELELLLLLLDLLVVVTQPRIDLVHVVVVNILSALLVPRQIQWPGVPQVQQFT